MVRLDKILNKAIKATAEVITTLLTNVITICLLKNKLLVYYKKTITVVL